MAAERISQVLIRMLPPDSVFLPARDFPQNARPEEGQSLSLPALEVSGLHFQPADPIAAANFRRTHAIHVLEEYCWA
jgi:hypothetical protein